MSREFRYPLTRYCLRSGTMTLPQKVVGLFHEGPLRAVDAKTGQELELAFTPPRTVSGLGELYRAHGLAVNDELLVRAQDDGAIAITAVARPRTPDFATPEGVAQLLDELSQSSLRMTVQEIRAYYGVPEEVDLAAALEADGRFTQREGRWVDLGTAAEIDAVEAPPQRVAPAAAQASEREKEEESLVAVGATVEEEVEASVPEAVAPFAGGRPAFESQATALHSGAPLGMSSPGGLEHVGGGLSAAPAQPGLWAQAEAARHEAKDEAFTVHERRTPAPSRPHAVALDEEEDAYVEAVALTDRLRRLVTPLGFAVEPLARGQVSLVANMGRRGYKVLVQLLSRTERVDWADLLSKRRTLDYRHLAVVGEHQPLVRLTGPAELARATLWSWQGLERVAALQKSLPLSPVDLEPHFERDGLFEAGLERFEARVSERLAERGAFSEVLTRLSLLRAPTVFLLEDLVSEVSLPRDKVLAMLERLSAAPFSLLARVDTGEFVLRQPVGAALETLSSYALSLRERLPERKTERLTGTGEPLLLEEDEDLLDGAGEEGPATGGISA
jgi:hypothetical protein